jgi:hypothetical protein
MSVLRSMVERHILGERRQDLVRGVSQVPWGGLKMPVAVLPHDTVVGVSQPDLPFDVTRLTYGCCFCEEGIEASGVDPCAVVLIGKWQGPEDEQVAQQFWCHFNCFADKLDPKIRPELRVEATPDL